MKFVGVNDLNEICFKDDSINIITDMDEPISDEIYNMFFEQQSIGKQFKIKDIQGATFEEIFEEYQQTHEDVDEQPLSETDELKQRIAKLEAMVEALLQEKQN
jgi:hypothetical protein